MPDFAPRKPQRPQPRATATDADKAKGAPSAAAQAVPAQGTGFEAQRDALRPGAKSAGKAKPADPAGLRSAVAEAGSLLTLMRRVSMYDSEDVGISRDFFAYAYNDQKNEDWLKDQFRAVMPNMHEWIPSNQIDEIMSKVHTTDGADDWVFLHNEMRTATKHLIFKPEVSSERAPDGSLVLRGHAGAVYVKGAPQIKDQPRFHDECRDVFVAATSTRAAIEGMQALAAKWIWDGAPTAAPLSRGMSDSMGVPLDVDRLPGEQAAHYADMMAMFDRMMAKHGT